MVYNDHWIAFSAYFYPKNRRGGDIRPLGNVQYGTVLRKTNSSDEMRLRGYSFQLQGRTVLLASSVLYMMLQVTRLWIRNPILVVQYLHYL
jgi:hypothetical protein